jgi:hypothetical protein
LPLPTRFRPVQHLPVQVGLVHPIVVGDADARHARFPQGQRRPAAQAARADQQDAAGHRLKYSSVLK